jgi:phasin
MTESRLQATSELRNLAGEAVDQAEKVYDMFFDAANKSVASIPSPAMDISKKALSFTDQNMRAAFDHSRKLVHAADLQEAIQVQSDFLKSQFTNSGEQMKQIRDNVMSAAKDAWASKVPLPTS